MTELSIGIVCFPTLGGSGVVASELASGLARRGHEIHLIATAPPSRDYPRCENETFHQVAVPAYPLFEYPPYTLAVAAKIVDVARAHRLDLLQVHYALPHAASAVLARQMLGRDAPALVTSLHGTDVTRIGSDPAYKTVTAYSVAESDGVTVPSDFLRREARRRLEIPESLAIDVLPNFVDTERFTPATTRDRALLDALFPRESGDGPVLIHVSNFRPVKRVADLMDVLAHVRRTLPARLVVIGDGPHYDVAVRRAAELRVDDSVRFLGRRIDFVNELRHADAFILPSETESFGVAAAEALSSGVPVFAYRVGGLPEVVVDGVGALVEPFDVAALARAIVQVVGDPGKREAAGRAARAHAVAHFGEGPALDRFEKYFRGVIQRRDLRGHQ